MNYTDMGTGAGMHGPIFSGTGLSLDVVLVGRSTGWRVFRIDKCMQVRVNVSARLGGKRRECPVICDQGF